MCESLNIYVCVHTYEYIIITITFSDPFFNAGTSIILVSMFLCVAVAGQSSVYLHPYR